MTVYIKSINSPISFKLESDSTSQQELLEVTQKDSRIPLATVGSLDSFDGEPGSCLDSSLAAEHSNENFDSPEFHWSDYKHLSSSPLSPSLAEYLPGIEDYSSLDYSSSSDHTASVQPTLSSPVPVNLPNNPQLNSLKTLTTRGTRQRLTSRNSLDDLSISHLNSTRRAKPITPHRLIEKRRRDKINTSLQQLKALVLSPSNKSSRSRLDKADILKLAIDHIKMLHSTNKENSEAVSKSKEANANMAEEELNIEGFRQPKNQSQSGSNTVSVGQHVMLGYMDCHQEAIDFLTKQANIPEDHPLVQQLNKHLLTQQQNLDFKAIEKNLELAEELREVAERHSGTSESSDIIDRKTQSLEGFASRSNMPLTNQMQVTLKPTNQQLDDINWRQTDLSLVNNSFALNNNGPIAETFVSSSCQTTVPSPSIQKTPCTQLRRTHDFEKIELLPSFPVFAMQYLTSNNSQKSPAPEITSPIFSV